MLEYWFYSISSLYRFCWVVRIDHSFTWWNDLCCKGNGKNRNEIAIIDRRRHYIQVWLIRILFFSKLLDKNTKRKMVKTFVKYFDLVSLYGMYGIIKTRLKWVWNGVEFEQIDFISCEILCKSDNIVLIDLSSETRKHGRHTQTLNSLLIVFQNTHCCKNCSKIFTTNNTCTRCIQKCSRCKYSFKL